MTYTRAAVVLLRFFVVLWAMRLIDRQMVAARMPVPLFAAKAEFDSAMAEAFEDFELTLDRL